MKKILTLTSFLIIGIALVYFVLKTIRSFGVVDELARLDTEHFVINYQGIYEGEAREIGGALESNYERIRTELNGPSHETVQVFIHPAQADFNKGTGLSNSTANGTSRGPLAFHIIWTNWFNSIFPDDPQKTAMHEFTHCIQLNILIKDAMEKFDYDNEESFNKAFERKFEQEYPQWFWEALCTYEAGEVNSLSVKYAMRNKLSLDDLNNSNQIYNVGYTLIEYIVDAWGKEKIPALITSYVDIENVLGVSAEKFEQGWREFVEGKY